MCPELVRLPRDVFRSLSVAPDVCPKVCPNSPEFRGVSDLLRRVSRRLSNQPNGVSAGLSDLPRCVSRGLSDFPGVSRGLSNVPRRLARDFSDLRRFVSRGLSDLPKRVWRGISDLSRHMSDPPDVCQVSPNSRYVCPENNRHAQGVFETHPKTCVTKII